MKALDLIFAARPMLHLPLWSIYLVSLHYHYALSGEKFGWSNIIMLACLSLVASGAYYINQIYDRESDRINDKVGFLKKGFLTERNVMAAHLLTSVAAIAISFYYKPVTVFIVLQMYFFGFLYSVPPFRLKDRPIYGLLVNMWGIGFLTAFLVMPEIGFHNAGYLGWDNPFYFAFAVGSSYILTTIPDRQGDGNSGKRTLAVWIGRSGAIVCALILSLASVWAAYKSDFPWLIAVAVIACVLTIASLVTRLDRLLFGAIKLPILLLSLLAGYFYPGFLLFMIAMIVGTRLYYRKRFGVTYPRLT